MEEGRVVKFAPFKPLPKLDHAINEGLMVRKMLYENFVAGRSPAERMDPMINMYDLMKLVDNTTKVRIEVKSEEMALTPHKLAVYGEHMVKKVFVNCQGELEVELSDEKPMHCR